MEITPTTEATPAPAAVTPATTPATATPATTPAAPPAEEAKKEPVEKRKAEEDKEEAVISKLAKLGDEDPEVKAFLTKRFEASKLHERIAEIQIQKAATQYAQGICQALNLKPGTPAYEQSMGEYQAYAKEHPDVLRPIIDQLAARQAEESNLSAPATAEKPKAVPVPPPAPPKAPATEKKGSEWMKNLMTKTQHKIVTDAVPPAPQPTASSSSRSLPLGNNTDTRGPFARAIWETPGFNKPLLQSDNMIIGKASSKNENANEINSALVDRFNAWKPLTTGEAFNGVAPDRIQHQPQFFDGKETDLYLQALHQTYAGRMLVKI